MKIKFIEHVFKKVTFMIHGTKILMYNLYITHMIEHKEKKKKKKDKKIIRYMSDIETVTSTIRF